MKKIILAGALAIVAASPALAATRHHPHRAVTANQAYAYVPAAGNTVVDDGQVLGTDPDPFIRGQLLREGNPGDLEGGN
ncbi:MAG: hypothetical protein WC670_03620 [Pseudolabrys sp.]|jgi:hypothetical protein